MESWLAGRPVLVHALCAVTRGHAQRSEGGLWFDTYESFVDAINYLQQDPARSTQMGQNGRDYVMRNYTWDAILDRFEAAINDWNADS